MKKMLIVYYSCSFRRGHACADSKWTDASIDEAIDVDTQTNLKDDFYTAVNKVYAGRETDCRFL